MTTHLVAFAEGLVMGTVTQSKGGRLTFLYSDQWLASSGAYPLSVSIPLASGQQGQRKIEPFLWGLLPDNEIVLGQWARKFHVSPRNVFGLIASVGEDCAGAVQFVQPERLDAVRLGARPEVQWPFLRGGYTSLKIAAPLPPLRQRLVKTHRKGKARRIVCTVSTLLTHP